MTLTLIKSIAYDQMSAATAWQFSTTYRNRIGRDFYKWAGDEWNRDEATRWQSVAADRYARARLELFNLVAVRSRQSKES